MSDYILKLDEAEAEHMAQLAKERGYASLVDYLRALVAADTLVEELRADWHDTEESAQEIEISLREAWHDSMTGNIHPIESLWDASNRS